MTEKQENKHSKHPMKKWDKVKGENSWTMFKVISEFVMGFETLNKLGPCVSIFGLSLFTTSRTTFFKVKWLCEITHE